MTPQQQQALANQQQQQALAQMQLMGGGAGMGGAVYPGMAGAAGANLWAMGGAQMQQPQLTQLMLQQQGKVQAAAQVQQKQASGGQPSAG